MILDRINAVVQEIEKNEFTELLDFQLFPPVELKWINKFEEIFKMKTPGFLRNFFLETNGLLLKWKASKNISDVGVELFSADELYEDNNESKIIGSINIIPFENIFFSSEYLGSLFDEADLDSNEEFRDKEFTVKELLAHLKPFDLFDVNHDYYCMAFFLNLEKKIMEVILLVDYYADFESSRVTDFESYFNFLISSKGMVLKRSYAFEEYRGDLKPKMAISLQDAEIYIPKLFGKNKD